MVVNLFEIKNKIILIKKRNIVWPLANVAFVMAVVIIAAIPYPQLLTYWESSPIVLELIQAHASNPSIPIHHRANIAGQYEGHGYPVLLYFRPIGNSNPQPPANDKR